MPVPVAAVAMALPAILEALGMAASLLQSVNNEEDDVEALARLDAQIPKTEVALNNLKALIAQKRAEATPE